MHQGRFRHALAKGSVHFIKAGDKQNINLYKVVMGLRFKKQVMTQNHTCASLARFYQQGKLKLFVILMFNRLVEGSNTDLSMFLQSTLLISIPHLVVRSNPRYLSR